MDWDVILGYARAGRRLVAGDLKQRGAVAVSLFVLACVTSLFIANSSLPRFNTYLGFHNPQSGIKLRAIAFLASIAVLFGIIRREVVVYFRENRDMRAALTAVFVFLGMMSLILNLRLLSQGELYGNITVSPFSQDTGWYYRRLLVPALSYYLQFRGPTLYTVFTYGMSLLMIYVMLVWLRAHDIKPDPLQALSIFSCGFVAFQYQYPGYCEQMVVILAFLSLLLPLGYLGRAAVLVLMLLTHEGSAFFIGVPLIVGLWKREEIPYFIPYFIMYGFFWMMNYDFNVSALFVGHLKVGEVTAWQTFVSQPGFFRYTFLALFFSEKILWLFVPFAAYYLFTERRSEELAGMLIMVFFPFLFFWGIDSSKFFGWSFIGILLATVYCRPRMPDPLFNTILLVNLILPSLYVGTNIGPILPRGLYALWKPLLGFVGLGVTLQ
jgi:hypothetical protein